MYKISQLADLLGLSRTTLLYYEKLGLIRGQRLDIEVTVTKIYSVYG